MVQRAGQIVDGWLGWIAITPRLLTCVEILVVVLMVIWIAKGIVDVVRRRD